MAHPYLESLNFLAELHLADRFEIDCRHFFSGAALYSNGAICASLSPVGLAFKLSESRCAELIEAGSACPLRYFAKSPIKKDYVLFRDFDELDADTVGAYFVEALAQSNLAGE
jgi:TfoX/Sxy family transcriptional regulator of competence genes